MDGYVTELSPGPRTTKVTLLSPRKRRRTYYLGAEHVSSDVQTGVYASVFSLGGTYRCETVAAPDETFEQVWLEPNS